MPSRPMIIFTSILPLDSVPVKKHEAELCNKETDKNFNKRNCCAGGASALQSRQLLRSDRMEVIE